MVEDPQGCDAPKQHHLGEHWSSANPIPKIQEFISWFDSEKRERSQNIDKDINGKRRQADDSGDKILEQYGQQDDEAIPHQARKISKHKTRIITDPTTGKEIEIEDQDEESMKAVKDSNTIVIPNANLSRETPVRTDSRQPFSDYKENQDITAPPDPIAQGTASDVPIRGEKTNVLFHPTPSTSFQPMFDRLMWSAAKLCTAIIIATIFLGRIFGGSLQGLIPLGTCIGASVWLWMREVIRSGRESEWSSEQLRGKTVSVSTSSARAATNYQSVEWINTFVGVIWGLMNPETLAPVADIIEDIMQASMPRAVENVRIAEINQGNNALRILSIRALPDDHVKHMKQGVHKAAEGDGDTERAKATEEAGSCYNLEASFAYHAKPSVRNASSKARNMHMQVVFYLGVQSLLGIPFPVFVELIELVGTVRLRLQMTPDPPFLKDLTFSLVGFPHVRAGCTPMFRTGINILDIPVISNFVNYAIRTASSLFAAPKSMTVDMNALLKGDEIHKDTVALGIIWIRIYRAVGLSKQDKRGSEGGGSDTYINLSYSKYKKPMYCTRVITDDLNPVWEEAAALLVTPELIKADERLSVELWDSDRFTADDIVGKVEMPLREMLHHPGKMYPRVSRLQGLNKGTEMPGRLHWELGYFGKPRLRSALRSDGKRKDLPGSLQDDPAFQDEKGSIRNTQDDAVLHTPPDPIWPSAILHIVIHQIVNLQLANIKGSRGPCKRGDYDPARPYGESMEEQDENLPTSYCKINLNDKAVGYTSRLLPIKLTAQIYRTRAKAATSKPIFNTSTEQFVRDWRSAIVTITVRCQRYREHDPILGVVPLKLSDIYQTSSQVTRWYPLSGGIGFGRIRISLLLRHIEIKLPPNMIGWDVGTFRFTSEQITAKGFSHKVRINLRTGGSSAKIGRRRCQVEGSDMHVGLNDQRFCDSIRLPIRNRYRSPVVFEFHRRDKLGSNAVRYAVLWLHELTDNEDVPVDIPIWSTADGNRLVQNYITESNWRLKGAPSDLCEVGRLQFRGIFSPGIDESHERFVTNGDLRENYEVWEACVADGIRPRRLVSELPDEVQRLHKESLTEGRSMLKQADRDERQRWLGERCRGRSDAFEHDPRAYTDSQRRKTAEPDQNSPKNDSVNQLDATGREPQWGEPDSTQDASDALAGTAHRTAARSSERSRENTEEMNRRSSERSRENTEEMNRRMDHRQQRGLMQWKLVRNVVFARDQANYALRRVKKKLGGGGLAGREPDIETEIT